MITTSEKIPNLAVLNGIIDEINDQLDQNEGQENFKNPIKFWVAGGAITSAITRSTINDIDIFSPTPQKLKKRLKKAIGYSTYESDHFTNFKIGKMKVQIITRYEPQTPEALFKTFDFTIVCGAYDGKVFHCHDRFWQDIANRRLVVNELFFPLKTLERVAKYAQRGYSACPVGLLALARSINDLDIDWSSPNQNLLSFYPDGTPRFEGVD